MMRATTMIFSVLAVLLQIVPAAATPVSSWSESHKSKARLIVGRATNAKGESELYAGVEIEMSPGWKTYWRSPGDAGGVPPYFDWSKSQNLAATQPLFPAPHRFKEEMGDSVGYKGRVVFPVRISGKDAGQPIGLALEFQYGVCREICIPAQAKLALQFVNGDVRFLPPQLATALDGVPRALASGTVPGRPRLVGVTADLGAAKPEILIDAAFPAADKKNDVFVEAGEDVYLPMTKLVASSDPKLKRYRIDLSDGVDVKALRGRKLRLTLVSPDGSVEAAHVLE